MLTERYIWIVKERSSEAIPKVVFDPTDFGWSSDLEESKTSVFIGRCDFQFFDIVRRFSGHAQVLSWRGKAPCSRLLLGFESFARPIGLLVM